MRTSIVTLLTFAVVTAGSVAGQTDTDAVDMRTGDFKLFELLGNNGEGGGFVSTLIQLFKTLRGSREDGGSVFSTLLELFKGSGDGSGFMDIIKNIMQFFSFAGEGDDKMGRMRMPGKKGGLEPLFAIMGVLKTIKENTLGDMDVSDPGKILLDIYGDICCVDNCTEKATTCAEAMKPPGNISYYHQKCFPEVLLAVVLGKNPLSVMGICVVENIFNELELEYQLGEPEVNAEAYLNKTTSNLTGDAGQKMVDAVRDGTCVPPTIETFQMMDPLKFKICLMNTCVNAVVV